MTAPRIFVNIASYRDPECQWTVKSLFENANRPSRVFAGICSQFVPDEDGDLFVVKTRPDQCRVLEFDARDSLGACWARHKADALWQGEDYVLRIDSHMRFAEGWDEKLLAMLAKCPSEQPVLSSYPPGYTPPDTLSPPTVSAIYARGFDDDGMLTVHAKAIAVKDAPAIPERTAFCAAGLLFASSRILDDVPYDPHLYFKGEEATMAVRLWTSGWDIFSPNDVVAYHDYSKHAGRRRHWNDNERWKTLNQLAFARARHLLAESTGEDPESLIDVARYGLGTRRTLAEYTAFSGIDFARRLIGGKTSTELQEALSPEEKRQQNADVFAQIHRDNSWGAEETRCGAGSTLAQTEVVRRSLTRLFDYLDIRVLGDAGCGDLNWMSRISGDLRLYLGFDVVGSVVDDLRKRFRSRANHFFAQTDVTLDDLPVCDAILCRDVLTHLTHAQVTEALRRFQASGSRYLVATTHDRGTNTAIKVGGWSPIDLMAPPFNLPPPQTLISEELENSTKALGVWLLKDIA